MSIYATLAHFGIKRFGDQQLVEIFAQAVPPHIDYTGPQWGFLPAPVDPKGDVNRAVFFVEKGDDKGTERNGQEYVKPLLMLTGQDYLDARFVDLIARLESALDAKYGKRPDAIAYNPDGSIRKIYLGDQQAP